MDRFTNGELDAMIAAVQHVMDPELELIPAEDAQWLESALGKLIAQRQAQE